MSNDDSQCNRNTSKRHESRCDDCNRWSLFLRATSGAKARQRIGQLSMEEKHNLTLFKPGVYWDDKAREDIAAGSNPRFKARGFKASDFKTQLQIVDNAFKGFTNPRNRPKKHMDLSILLDRPSFPIGRWTGWPEVTFKPTFRETWPIE